MTDEPSRIAREAKSIHQGLKELLKTREPWDKETEFQRRNLRRQYLRLLLLHPYTNPSRDAETHLWMQTSYAFISSYKQRITELDTALQGTPRQNKSNTNGHGPVEYRKLLRRFRQFLADEEKFWTQLLTRYRRCFELEELQPALLALGFAIEGEEEEVPDDAQGTRRSGGRNRFEFPPQEASASVLPANATQRAALLSICSKTLVCLGDLARYKEQFNEGGGRPKAIQEYGPPAAQSKRNNRNRPPDVSRNRNYEIAQQRYEHARLISPSEGNAAHQLAILAAYQKDAFGALVHYYRAMCVRQPYDTASENLSTVLKKALKQWEATRSGQRPTDPPNLSRFKEDLVVLHALWNQDAKSDVENGSPSIRATQAQQIRVETAFRTLVSQRNMPIDVISKVIVIAVGALWREQMVRQPNCRGKPAQRSFMESLIRQHILDLFRSLLDIGVQELKEGGSVDAVPRAEEDLAQRITATFRRTLPALRISSKWVRANIRDLAGDDVAIPSSVGKRGDARRHNRSQSRVSTDTAPAKTRQQFWEAYAAFADALARTFPPQQLPPLDAPLEEDIDMRGFLPLRNLMFGESVVSRTQSTIAVADNMAGHAHPNIEQLMRIWDLLGDVRSVAGSGKTPVSIVDGHFLAGPASSSTTALAASSARAQESAPSSAFTIIGKTSDLIAEDDTGTDTNRADDDLVRDAFRQALGGSDDDTEEDEIVWNPRAPASPPSVPIEALSTIRARTIAPPQTSISPGLPLSDSSPSRQPPIGTPRVATKPVQSPLTAEELVNSVMGYDRSPAVSSTPRSPVLQDSGARPLPFGNGSPLVPTQSIWSTPLEPSMPLLPSQGLRSFASDGQSGHNIGQNTLNRPDSFLRQQPLPATYGGLGARQRAPFQDPQNWLPSPHNAFDGHEMYSSTPSGHRPLPAQISISSHAPYVDPHPDMLPGAGFHHARNPSRAAFSDPAIVSMSFGPPASINPAPGPRDIGPGGYGAH